MALLDVRDLKIAFYDTTPPTEVVKGISFSLEEGETLGIVGESGSGKSTLMNIMGILDRQTSGNYFLEGEDVNSMDDTVRSVMRNKKIGFVFQNFNLIPRANALKNVTLPLMYSEHRPKNAKEIGMQMLELVGMADRATHRPNELSGGQKQRAAVARALITRPQLILADEPTGNLDSKTSQDVLSLLKVTSQKFAQTIVMITHNEEIAQMADRIIRIEDGRIVSQN